MIEFSFPGFLASANVHGSLQHDWTQTPSEIVWQILLIIFFVLLNGFFVAAEFAIVKVRASQIESLLQEGRKRVATAKNVIEHLDAYLSATQLGITLASLALGWLGEPFIAKMLHPFFFKIWGDDISETFVRTASFIIAFGIITFLHIVLGELMPKSLAIRKSLGTTIIVAKPLKFFYVIFKIPIYFLNGCANKLLKVFFKIDPVGEHELVHSADELLLLVQETEKSEEVTPTEREILIAALSLNDLHVRDVLTPRSEVISLDPSIDFQENLKKARESGHTRFPLAEGHLDNSTGLIHIKDVLKIVDDSDPDITEISRALPTVPEMMALDNLLKLFQREQVHMAVVVDEFGGTLGIVTLDNVIEELVGDIQDEFDKAEDEREYFKINDNEFVVEGTLPLYELGELTEIKLENPDVSTIGGYVTHLLGHLPEKGESVTIGGYRATVIVTDGKSVGRLRFYKLAEDELPAPREDEPEA